MPRLVSKTPGFSTNLKETRAPSSVVGSDSLASPDAWRDASDRSPDPGGAEFFFLSRRFFRESGRLRCHLRVQRHNVTRPGQAPYANATADQCTHRKRQLTSRLEVWTALTNHTSSGPGAAAPWLVDSTGLTFSRMMVIRHKMCHFIDCFPQIDWGEFYHKAAFLPARLRAMQITRLSNYACR